MITPLRKCLKEKFYLNTDPKNGGLIDFNSI